MMTKQQVAEAVAQGWCDPSASHKEMDGDLAIAIADAVFAAQLRGASDAQGLTTVPARLSESSGHPTSEPVAWMHDQDGRVDVIHDKVKALWLRMGQPDGFYREKVPCKVEHYTIPLFASPPEQAPVEPVAWVTKIGILLPPYEPMHDDVPLYTSPPDHTKAMRLALEALNNSVYLVWEEYTEAERKYGNYPPRRAKLDGMKAMAQQHDAAITALEKQLGVKP